MRIQVVRTGFKRTDKLKTLKHQEIIPARPQPVENETSQGRTLRETPQNQLPWLKNSASVSVSISRAFGQLEGWMLALGPRYTILIFPTLDERQMVPR